MYCAKCGKLLNGSEKFCSRCGNRIVLKAQDYGSLNVNNKEQVGNAENQEGILQESKPLKQVDVPKESEAVQAQTQADSPETVRKIPKIGDFFALQTIAFILLVCTVFVPMFTGTGLFPTEDSWTVKDTIECLMDDGLEAIRFIPVTLHIISWIPAALLLLSSTLKSRIASVFISCAGILLPGVYLIYEAINLEMYFYYFDFEEGMIGIGFYIELILFIACFVTAIDVGKEENRDNMS